MGRKKKKKSWVKAIADYDDDVMFVDGFDDCIMGVVEGFNITNTVVYDLTKVIEKLAKDMNYEEAWEHYSFNMRGAYVGNSTPMYMIRARDL